MYLFGKLRNCIDILDLDLGVYFVFYAQNWLFIVASSLSDPILYSSSYIYVRKYTVLIS